MPTMVSGAEIFDPSESGPLPRPRRRLRLLFAMGLALVLAIDVWAPAEVAIAALYVPLLLAVQHVLRPRSLLKYAVACCLCSLAASFLSFEETAWWRGLFDRGIVCAVLVATARIVSAKVTRERLASTVLFQPWGFSGEERSALLAMVGDMQREAAMRRSNGPDTRVAAAATASPRQATLVGFAFGVGTRRKSA
jgi:hypothetical protein